ncbi:peptidase S8/S53 domain-containing protein [Aspergillus novoparasiticus]|uniref:Peptidase S8/S53 domain-containing protein n=1 Tax=Aspergillus novoparasiticus TaxID=986946 RepID=A0A5N6E6M3_9EURO|nr:peptidase S8/S53 domain-containing protein [Aspergillus novoparasiticus]
MRVEYPVPIKRKLLSGLRKQSLCSLCPGLDASQDSLRWHPTRLLLEHRPPGHDSHTLDFNVIVTKIPTGSWQDIGLSVPRRDKVVKFVAEQSQQESPNRQLESGLGQGMFCRILSDDIFARVCFEFHNGNFVPLFNGRPLEQRPSPGFGITLTTVLQRYTLTLKDKINLAHITAEAFWQFYNTELVYRKWTSDCVFFMPEQHGDVLRLPNKPYISLQFELGDEDPDEYLSENSLVHRYPRILAFAIMLIEIAQGRSLQLRQCNSLASQVNADFDVAYQELGELRKSSWDSFQNKDIFIQAIVNCLINDNYRPDLNVNITTSTVPITATDFCCRGSLEISQRRKAFYDKVVWPLQWLAEVGFRGDQNTSYLNEKQSSLAVNFSLLSLKDDIKEDIQLPSAQFHGNRQIDPKRWLDDLKAINRAISPGLRRLPAQLPAESKEVRVAILDTGYNPNAPLLADVARSRRFKGWKDFVSGSDTPIDTFGHGTFMATLLVESAPISEVHVARVAENTNSLQQSSLRIAEGIRWAGLAQKANIIFMSFGFSAPDEEAYEEISGAIDEVQKKRRGRIIFLASAGNSGVYDDETFPAKHPSVISIRATDSLGTFLKTNPENRSECPTVFGAIGDDIPEHLQQFYPDVSLPGSSAATAIAAGIAAIMLAYVLVLPQLVKTEHGEAILKRLWTPEGMRKMFMKMSDDMGQRRRFLNPSKFFLNKRTPESRYFAIYDCL